MEEQDYEIAHFRMLAGPDYLSKLRIRHGTGDKSHGFTTAGPRQTGRTASATKWIPSRRSAVPSRQCHPTCSSAVLLYTIRATHQRISGFNAVQGESWSCCQNVLILRFLPQCLPGYSVSRVSHPHCARSKLLSKRWRRAKFYNACPSTKLPKELLPALCSILRGRNRCLIIGSLVISVVSQSISPSISGSITVLVPLAPLTVECRVPLQRTLADARSATSVSRVLTAN